MSETTLSKSELSRYARHLILPEVGLVGQQKLKASKVLIIGTGGLGAPVGMYLSAAGIGTLGLVDFDTVDESNLQRQIIHSTKNLGRLKVESARERLQDINPHVNVNLHPVSFNRDNALAILTDYDIVVDCTDNFASRYLINDACVLQGKPNVYGSIYRFEGQASVLGTPHSACYRCLYPEPPPRHLVPSCSESGVIGVLPGIIGSIQANEVIKLALDAGETLANRLLLFNAWKMEFRELKFSRDPACPVCGDHPSITELQDYESFCSMGAETIDESIQETTCTELHAAIQQGKDWQLIDVREEYEFSASALPHSRNIPLQTILRRITELDPTREVILLCQAGIRSRSAAESLRAANYTGTLRNLTGGLQAWSQQIYPL